MNISLNDIAASKGISGRLTTASAAAVGRPLDADRYPLFQFVIISFPNNIGVNICRCNLHGIKGFLLSIFMVSLVRLRFRFHFGIRCLRQCLLNLDFTLHCIEGPCCRPLKILLFSGMGMLITVWNQYPVQSRTTSERVGGRYYLTN